MEKKLAILHRYPPAQVVGTNASFVEFLKALSERGYTTFYLTYKGKGEKPVIKNLTYVELPFYFNRGNNFDKILKTYLWILLAPFYVLYLQNKYNLDIVYCDDSVPYYGFLAKLLSPKSKVVIRLGDLQTGYSLADKHKNLFKLALSVEVFMWNKLDGLIAISDPFRKFIVNQGVNKKKVKVVEESINLDDTDGYKKILNRKNFVISFHGSLVKCKGTEVLLRAFRNFSKTYENSKLIIAGSGGEDQFLKKLASDLNIKNVEFVGWFNHEKLKEIFGGVDVSVVMRSPNMANNFVVTTCLLESWKFKKPVIAPNLESFKGVIKDKFNGILFKVGDENDLKNKIMYLYKNKSVWKKLGDNGFNTAKKLFDYKMIGNKMVDSLESYL